MNLYDLLQIDVHYEILKRLTPLDYLNFSAVSRFCRSVASHDKWRSTTSVSFPMLLYTYKDRSHFDFITSFNNSFFIKIPNALQDTTTIHYSDHGWVLMSKDKALYSYNPFTLYSYNPFPKDVLSYTCPYEPEQRFFFTSKPCSSDNVLIGITFFWPALVVVNVCVKDRWTRHVVETLMVFEARDNAPVLFEGAYYYLDQDGFLGKLELNLKEEDEEEVIVSFEIVARRPWRKWIGSKNFYHNYLVECGGDLLSVFLGRAERWVHVYKFKKRLGFKEAWECVRSLSGYTLYLSQSSCFSVVSSPGEGNKIYFPDFRGGGSVLYYCLDTRKWDCRRRDSSYDTNRTQDSSNDTTKSTLDFCWIRPSWRH